MCGICGKLSTNYLCNKCNIILKKQSINGIENYKNENKYFEEHLYYFMYDGIIRKILLKYKFNEKSYIYKTLSKFLLNNKKIVGNLKYYDIIIPVPISNKRWKQRGYNQCELIAKDISKNTNLKFINNCLYKEKNNPPQSILTKKAREQNVRGMYKIRNKKIIQNKKIILFDDIYTTGNTVNECSKILKQNGAKKIGILTIAKD